MQQETRVRNASRNVVFGMFLKGYQILLPFIMRTAIMYYMGDGYLGLNSLFGSVLWVLNLAELGVGSAMVYSMYQPIIDNDKEQICALLKLYQKYYRIIGLVIAVVGGILTPFIPYLVKSDMPEGVSIYVVYLLNLFCTCMSYWLLAYKNSLLTAHQRNDVASKVMLVTNTFQYAAQLVVVMTIGDYYIYLIVQIFTQIVTNLVTAYFANKMYPEYKAVGKLPKETVKKINNRIRDLFTMKVGQVIVSSADTIVISAFLGLAANAFYAVAMFGEKYGDVVRVVEMGDVSMEFCGGTHLDNTAKVGLFRIKSEGSVASGVRRIEAITGKQTLEELRSGQEKLIRAAQLLKTTSNELESRIGGMLSEMKEIKSQLEKFKEQASLGEARTFLTSAKEVKGLKLVKLPVLPAVILPAAEIPEITARIIIPAAQILPERSSSGA